LSAADSGTPVPDQPSGMPDAEEAASRHAAYQRLRDLAAENAREARLAVMALLESDAPVLEYILLQAAAPGEGRLRHVIANAVRLYPAKDLGSVIDHLERWLAIETDTFARRAIEQALSGVPRNPAPGRLLPPGAVGFSDELPRTYRYVAAELRHEVRNALIEVRTPLRELRVIAESLPANDPLRTRLEEQVQAARTALSNAGRSVEFQAGEKDEYYQLRSIALYDWLKGRAIEYATMYPAEMHLQASAGVRSLTVRASDYLLDIVFRNVWNNARQAVQGPCRITVHGTVVAKSLELLLTDNGPGFDAAAAEKAFQDPFSTKGAGHGHGLLAIDEAMTRMNGSVNLIAVAVGEFRLRLTFPLEVK
jgi:signal transduction histidine kinase